MVLQLNILEGLGKGIGSIFSGMGKGVGSAVTGIVGSLMLPLIILLGFILILVIVFTISSVSRKKSRDQLKMVKAQTKANMVAAKKGVDQVEVTVPQTSMKKSKKFD